MDLYNFIKIFIYKYHFPIFSYFLSEYHAILMNFYLSNVLQSIIVANFDAQVILNVTKWKHIYTGSNLYLFATFLFLSGYFAFSHWVTHVLLVLSLAQTWNQPILQELIPSQFLTTVRGWC